MLRRRRGAALTGVTIAIVLLGGRNLAGAQEPGSRLPAAYLTALASYRAGDLSAAFKKLESLDQAELTEVTRRLQRKDSAGGTSWPRLLTAAILLHTEAFLIRAEAGPVPASDPYLESAYVLVRRLLKLADEGEPGAGPTERMFVRDWYLLMVSFQHGRAAVGWSRAYLTEALEAFPRDPALTLALAADHEMLSDLTAGQIRYLDTAGRVRRQSGVDASAELREAIRLLSEVKAATPNMVEARMRLGRLLYRHGDLDAAARELAAARPLATQDEIVYLVALFSGMVEAARGHDERAGTFYAEARRRMPQAQSAIVAEAEAAYVAGRSREAAAIIQEALQQTDKQDPWWIYIMGEWWHFEPWLAGIRKYVQQ